jgi:hypothetical protein
MLSHGGILFVYRTKAEHIIDNTSISMIFSFFLLSSGLTDIFLLSIFYFNIIRYKVSSISYYFKEKSLLQSFFLMAAVANCYIDWLVGGNYLKCFKTLFKNLKIICKWNIIFNI